MRWILAACLIAIAAPAAAQGRYGNARFGYGIDYPAELAPQPESDNSDGRAFRSGDGKVEALVWGGYNAEDKTAHQLDDDARADCTAKPSYERVAPTFFAVSCLAGANILYQKTMIRKDVLTSFRITYPVREHDHWDAVTTRMANSLVAAK